MPSVGARRTKRVVLTVSWGPPVLRRGHRTGGGGYLVLPRRPRGPQRGPARVADLPAGQRRSPPRPPALAALGSAAAPGWPGEGAGPGSGGGAAEREPRRSPSQSRGRVRWAGLFRGTESEESFWATREGLELSLSKAEKVGSPRFGQPSPHGLEGVTT